LNLWLAKWGRFEPAGSDQSAAIAALQSDVAALQSAIAALPDHAPAITDLQTRIAALEAAPPPSSPTVINVPPEGITLQFVPEEL
jgi:hypothetical protein